MAGPGGKSRRSKPRSRRNTRAGRRKAAAPGKSAAPKKKGSRQWSGAVTQHSDALDLEPAIFKSASASNIARSLKRSAERSTRRKGTPFQSAMSMLTFYMNRGGANLTQRRKQVLQRAKTELRKAFHRE